MHDAQALQVLADCILQQAPQLLASLRGIESVQIELGLDPEPAPAQLA